MKIWQEYDSHKRDYFEKEILPFLVRGWEERYARADDDDVWKYKRTMWLECFKIEIEVDEEAGRDISGKRKYKKDARIVCQIPAPKYYWDAIIILYGLKQEKYFGIKDLIVEIMRCMNELGVKPELYRNFSFHEHWEYIKSVIMYDDVLSLDFNDCERTKREEKAAWIKLIDLKISLEDYLMDRHEKNVELRRTLLMQKYMRSVNSKNKEEEENAL